jgi:hypothetical protein
MCKTDIVLGTYNKSQRERLTARVRRNSYDNGREDLAARTLKLLTVMNYKKSEYVEMGQLKRDGMKG